MGAGVAHTAKSNEVLLRVVAASAAKRSMMNLKVRHDSARLTPPAVAFEDTAM